MLGTHMAMDGQKMILCLSCEILMNRNSTRISFIAQTGIVFSVTKNVFHTDKLTSDFRENSMQAVLP